ncbi:MAG: gephyrin-like molybdotransferase Glp [Methanomassiliicoccales archaeon]
MTEMRPLGSLIQLDEAKELVSEHVPPIEGVEEVDLEGALHRVLAEEVVSTLDIPPYDRAAMDGYAVRAEDTFTADRSSPVGLECVSVVHAGSVPQASVEEGKCIQIATGAMLPRRADAVVKVEETEREGDTVYLSKPVHPSAHVSKRGEDVSREQRVLSVHDLLVPSKVGVLAAIGRERVKVYKKPWVAVMPTGDEVAPVGTELREGQVYDINSHTLSSILRENGCLPNLYPVVRDDRESLSEVLTRAASQSNMIVLSGGSSAGERDVLVDVIEELGEVIFHGVQMKPGKPTIFGSIDDVPIFGMPGYPTSCLTNGYVFLVDAARQMARLPPRRDMTVEVPIAKKFYSQLGRHQFLTVAIREGEAVPVFKESGTITSIAYADGWIGIPYNVDLIEKGTPVTVHLFDR